MLACAQAAPPAPTSTIEVPPGSIYPDEIKVDPPVDWRTLKQPQTLVDDLQRVQSGTLKERIEALKRKLANDMVFVEGGTFWMGDFGHLQSEEKLPWTGTLDNKPLRQVTLSSFSISRYKVTYAEFDLFTEATNKSKVQAEAWFAKFRRADVPVGVTWDQARDYCLWLGKQAKQPVALPTEAQWEYAARDRGKFIVYPTDSGKLEWDRNVPGSESMVDFEWSAGFAYSIARFPASALGLFDLARNGAEWMQDWYDAELYQRESVAKDPSGPRKGTFKVQRGWHFGNSGAAMTMYRGRNAPDERPIETPKDGTFSGGNPGDTFRCSIQSARR